MLAVIKKELLTDLRAVQQVLASEQRLDPEQLQKLSEHAIEDVALYKDLDVVSISVFLYSLAKIHRSLRKEDLQQLRRLVNKALGNLQQGNYGAYNRQIKSLFTLVRKGNARVKDHFTDVMHAARIKKGSSLLQRGLSIGQAAGLMGLSNWDLQAYAGRNVGVSNHEAVPATQRLTVALKLFGIS